MKALSINENRQHRQIFAFNLIRAVAIVMVVLDHSLSSDLSRDGHTVIKLLLNPDALLFFMISGALLLPVQGSYTQFLSRRLVKVFVPYVIWCMLYAVMYYSLGKINDYTFASQIRWSWLNFNFWSGWFVPVIIGLYLVMPILSPWVATASRKHFHYVIMLWIASGVLQYIQPIAGFSTEFSPLSIFMNAVPFAIAGYYIAHRGSIAPSLSDGARGRYRFPVICLLLFVTGAVLPFMLRNSVSSFDILAITYNWTSLSCIALALLYFSLLVRVRTLGARLDRVVNFISRYSYGIYLSHDMIQVGVVRELFSEYADSTMFNFCVMLSGGIVISVLLRRIPFIGRYLV